jgi:hypothetical protein
MTGPRRLGTILSELDKRYEAWVLQDEVSGKYVVIPDDRFPGRRPTRFFVKREDAESVLQELVEQNVSLRDKDVYPGKVCLLRALRGIAADITPGNANAFAFHSPNEVCQWVRDGK